MLCRHLVLLLSRHLPQHFPNYQSHISTNMAEHNGVRANTNGDTLEKDFSNGNGYTNGNRGQAYHLDDTNMGHGEALNRIRTAGSISISPELFEKIYLSPQNAVKGDLRKTFGNPTPVYVSNPCLQRIHTNSSQCPTRFPSLPVSIILRPHGLARRWRQRCCWNVSLTP